MKSRFNLWKASMRSIEANAKRRLGKSPDEGSFGISDAFFILSIFFLVKRDFLPESIPYNNELEIIIAVGIYALGLVISFYRMAPRPCWTKASWATGITAVVWSVLPWILYWAEEINLVFARNVSLLSIIMWVAFICCIIRLRYIRRRSKRDISIIHMRRKRRTAQQTY